MADAIPPKTPALLGIACQDAQLWAELTDLGRIEAELLDKENDCHESKRCLEGYLRELDEARPLGLPEPLAAETSKFRDLVVQALAALKEQSALIDEEDLEINLKIGRLGAVLAQSALGIKGGEIFEDAQGRKMLVHATLASWEKGRLYLVVEGQYLTKKGLPSKTISHFKHLVIFGASLQPTAHTAGAEPITE